MTIGLGTLPVAFARNRLSCRGFGSGDNSYQRTGPHHTGLCLHGIHASFRILVVIVSFADRATEALYHGARSGPASRVPPDVRATALRKLDMLNAAHLLTDLRVPPGNRLEALHGDLRGLHSIRVNAQWRVIFRWTPAGPAEVRIVDYHS